MSNKLIKYKFRNEYFAAYGLNKFKNFLNAPICECGCGNKTHILLKDDEALLNLTGQLLSEHDCENCAIFAHSYDNKLYATVKCLEFDEEDDDYEDGEVVIRLLGTTDDNLTFFQELDAEFGFHCYGLMIETKKGEWKIIED